MPPKRKTRLEQLRQAQKQNVIVNVHLAEKAKRRKKLRRGGANQATSIQRPQLQLATPRRLVQTTIHLPPEATPPQTPFRSTVASHPQYVRTTEHVKREREEAIKQMQMGIDAQIAKKLQDYERNATKPSMEKEIKVEFTKPKPNKPITTPETITVETPTPLRTRRTTVEMNEAIGMGKEDPNPLFARQAENINVRRLIRRYETPSMSSIRDKLDFDV